MRSLSPSADGVNTNLAVDVEMSCDAAELSRTAAWLSALQDRDYLVDKLD